DGRIPDRGSGSLDLGTGPAPHVADGLPSGWVRMRPIALVPAKGYSARLPRKNMRLLGDKPLLDWTLEAAKAAGCFADIWVCREDPEILERSREHGVQTLRRPDALALPAATISHVIQHARQSLEYPGPIYVLTPSSPFRSAMRMTDLWERFSKSQAGTL